MRSKSRRGIGKCVWRDIDLERSKIGRDVRTIAVNANDLYNSSSTSTSTERVKLTRVAARSRAKVGWSWSSNLSLLRVSAQVRHGGATAASGNKSLRDSRLMRQKKNPPPPPTQPSEIDHAQRDIRRSSTITRIGTAHLTHRGFRTYSLTSSTRAKTEQHMQKSTIETNM
jgi:reverse gyrase